MEPVMEPSGCCSFAACEVDHFETALRPQHALHLAEGCELRAALEVVEHERGEHAIEARRFAIEAVGEAALELNPDLGAAGLALRTRQGSRIRVDSDGLDVG